MTRWAFEREATCPACGSRCAVDKAGRLARHNGPWQGGPGGRSLPCPNRHVPAGDIRPRPLEVEA